MRPKSIILLVLALGCGLVASIGINRVMANRGAPVVVSGDTQPICVVTKDVNMNDRLTADDVKLEQWPVGKIPLGALTKLEDVEGRRSKYKLFTGEPLLEAKLLAKGETGASPGENIPPGFRVVAVRVDDVTTSGSLILPGDRVDMVVHLTQNSAKDVRDTTTQTFLQNVKVFAVNDTTERQPGGAENKIVARTVSVLVTPEQAELVTMAAELGRIRLVLRGPMDDQVAEFGDGTKPSDLFQQLRGKDQDPSAPAAPSNPFAALLPKPEPAALAPAVVDALKSTFTMTIIKGADAQDYELDVQDGRFRQRAPESEVSDEPVDPETFEEEGSEDAVSPPTDEESHDSVEGEDKDDHHDAAWRGAAIRV
jgi:pilus assembly protein CpaB